MSTTPNALAGVDVAAAAAHGDNPRVSRRAASHNIFVWVSTRRSTVQRATAGVSVVALLVLGVLPLYPSPSVAVIAGVAALATIAAAPPLYLWRLSRAPTDLRFANRYFKQKAAQEAAMNEAFSAQLDALRHGRPMRKVTNEPSTAASPSTTAGQPAKDEYAEASTISKWPAWTEVSPEERAMHPTRMAWVGTVVLREAGAGLAAVAFLSWWSSVYLLLWGLDSQSFTGLPSSPRVGEFIYLAVTATLGGTPEGVAAATSWAQMTVAGELISGVVLVALFVRVFSGSAVEPGSSDPF